MKKILLLSLALVMALGTLGVGYAAWTDRVTIGGTVNTGTLDVVVEYLSYMEVWKDLTTEQAVAVYYAIDADTGAIVGQQGTVPDPGVLVANTTADLVGTADDDAVSFSFNNLFPCD